MNNANIIKALTPNMEAIAPLAQLVGKESMGNMNQLDFAMFCVKFAVNEMGFDIKIAFDKFFSEGSWDLFLEEMYKTLKD